MNRLTHAELRFDRAQMRNATRCEGGGRRCPSCGAAIHLGPVASEHPERMHTYRCTCGQLVTVWPLTDPRSR